MSLPPESMTHPREQDTTREHFEARHDYWFAIYAQTDTLPGYNLYAQHDAAMGLIAMHLRGKGRVLDVGCGAGFTALALSEQGYAVSGVDLASTMIARAQQEVQARGLTVDFRVASAEALPYASASVDAVIALGLMGNLREDLPTLREMHRVLKDGGLVVLSMPNALGLDRWLSLPRTHTLILGYRYARLRRCAANGMRRLIGKQPKPLSAIRYGRSAVPWRYVRRMQAAGFTDVRCISLTFGGFMPFGFKLWDDRQHIAISRWIVQRRWLARWINWGGNMVLYYGFK